MVVVTIVLEIGGSKMRGAFVFKRNVVSFLLPQKVCCHVVAGGRKLWTGAFFFFFFIFVMLSF
jgi:hypothetical protein